MIVQIVKIMKTPYGESEIILVAKTFEDVKNWAEEKATQWSPPFLKEKVIFSQLKESEVEPGIFWGEFKIGSTKYWLTAIEAKGWD